MKHRGLLEIALKDEKFNLIIRALERGTSPQAIYGLTGSQKALWLAALLECNHDRPVIVVTEDLAEARNQASDLSVFTGEAVVVLPPREQLSLEVVAASPQARAQRIAALAALAAGRSRCLFVPVEAFAQKMVPPQIFALGQKKLQVGKTVDWSGLLRFLAVCGYQREELVEAPGQFSVRGGILDLFPLTEDTPWRIEFFDDEIDSIRSFDADSQRSLEKVHSIEITPAREVLITPEARTRADEALRRELEILEKSWQNPGVAEALEHIRSLINRLKESLVAEIWEESWDRLQGLFYPEQVSILKYATAKPLLVLDEPARLKEFQQHKEREIAETLTELLAVGASLPVQQRSLFSYSELEQSWVQHDTVLFSMLPKVPSGLSPKGLVTVAGKSMHAFFGKTDMLAEEIRLWKKEHYSVAVMVSEEVTQARLKEMLWDEGVEAIVTGQVEAPFYPGQVRIVQGTILRGFQWPEAKLVLVGEQEVFTRRSKVRPRKNFRQGRRITSFGDLKAGDYVVHLYHGIGRYVGIEQLEVEGTHKDYLLVEYGGTDRLYVPTEQLDLLQKYLGGEDGSPRLNKLGGSEWRKVKSRVRLAVEDLAENLLSLYAVREALPGQAFSPDTPWQREFEATFPYTETPDQLQAISEVKRDMERPRPMDRLLCGDVGYGKTEVALRAAFKATMDSKQVAILVPTTVLAQQHYRTVRERFSEYPVTVAVLSRFQSAKQQKESIRGLAEGNIDIVIGTHRLLSKDVRFKDLGLVVVDEEQRFGVSHKEKLKVLCRNVDVLTLTATPIPRTLHMSLIGVRDMSVIETPPEERYPVQTYVVEYNPVVVREAIRRELYRGGQVYFVHNRIADLPRIAGHLKELVPEARIGVAHGQMPESRLERLMLDFLEGEYDVLLCTTIVENGLDISNVNTLIVYDADKLGLSQLYQLRGRVGRSNRLAYAYFTYKEDKTLTSIAEKRLSAIKEFTEFGSGFKIAMRDLELRGAGNLLGAEQHGHMLAVGFDLYCRMLEDAVERLRKEKLAGKQLTVMEEGGDHEEAGITLDLKVNAYFDAQYLPDQGLKMEMYQRLARAGSSEEVHELREELVDRFGDPPQVVENLLLIAQLKVQAREALVSEIKQQGTRVIYQFWPEHPLKGQQLMQLAQKFPRRLSFSVSKGLTMEIKTIGARDQQLLSLLLTITCETIDLMSIAGSEVQQ